MAKFVVELVYGEDRDHLLAVRPEHREYARGLAEEGLLLAAGPFEGDRGSMLIYEVADADELQKLLREDPYAKAGVLADTTIREWHPGIGSWIA